MQREAIRLDIGSGDQTGESEFLRVDPFVDSSDIKAMMWDLPFADDSVDEIFTSHALEHIGRGQVVETLTEWRRVIKPGGKITIRVPDLVWCCEHWLQVAKENPTECDGWDMAVLFGSQTHEGEYHKTGFTYPLMAKYLYQAGLRLDHFEKLWTHSQQTLSFEVSK